jgi:hypothetical protein
MPILVGNLLIVVAVVMALGCGRADITPRWIVSIR